MCECTTVYKIELMYTFMILYATVRVKSSLSKSMQQSIYPVGRRWTFSTSQLYTAERIGLR